MSAIAIILPSRSRPEKAFDAAHSFLSRMSFTQPYQFVISLDTDDPYLNEYREIFPDKGHFQIVVSDNKNVVQAANAGAKATGADILMLISDDFVAFPKWDVAITDALKNKSGVLKTYDGVQKWIVTLPIMTRDYYEAQGGIYPYEMEHLFSDTYLTHKADLQGKLIIRNDIQFTHNHYSTNGSKPDGISQKANSTWDSGKKTYLNACKNHFGLGKNTDIFNLSDTAVEAGHVKWLKNELRKFKG